MRTLVIGDIHGGLRALHQVMERAHVTEKDKLIFLGDYVDGWSQSPQVLDYLIDLNTKNKCIFIRGNHDELLLHWLKDSKDNLLWYNHGGEATVLAYEKVKNENKQLKFDKKIIVVSLVLIICTLVIFFIFFIML